MVVDASDGVTQQVGKGAGAHLNAHRESAFVVWQHACLPGYEAHKGWQQPL